MAELPPPRFEHRESFLLAGLRRVHSPTSAAQSIREQWRAFDALDALPAMDSRRYGVMCGLTEAGFEYMTAFQVASFGDLPADIGKMRVPDQRYAIFELDDRPLQQLWAEIFAWLEHGPFRSAHRPDFELYPQSPAPTLPPRTEVWVSVVPAGA